MEFLNEKAFDQDRYKSCLSRIHYDDRDAVMYENMLSFLWPYVTSPDLLEDREGLLEEYSHWNLQLIDKCYYHMPHDLPYVNIRRAYQSVIHLLDGDTEAGLAQLELIGKEAFMQEGKADRLHMTKSGKVYQPCSRLFLLYNYDKLLRKKDPDQARKLREDYPYPFRVFGDQAHEDHDSFLDSQLHAHGDVIFYPDYERVYRSAQGPRDFFLYFDENKGIDLKWCL